MGGRIKLLLPLWEQLPAGKNKADISIALWFINRGILDKDIS